MENKKEKTAPDVSVGADTEQPISKNTISSISENGGNIKSFEELQALAIQSLPKEYVITKDLSKSDMFKTVGNGVPFLLAKEIAHSIRIFLENELQ